MKMKTIASTILLTLSLLATPFLAGAAEAKDAKKAKPYKLDTCLVSDEKLDDKAYVFTHEGREIKLCCKNCLKDFKKETAKFVKKLEESEKKAK